MSLIKLICVSAHGPYIQIIEEPKQVRLVLFLLLILLIIVQIPTEHKLFDKILSRNCGLERWLKCIVVSHMDQYWAPANKPDLLQNFCKMCNCFYNNNNGIMIILIIYTLGTGSSLNGFGISVFSEDTPTLGLIDNWCPYQMSHSRLLSIVMSEFMLMTPSCFHKPAGSDDPPCPYQFTDCSKPTRS